MSKTATQTKERPVIFGPESVRAILNNSKTQTRRVIKNAPKGDFWHKPASVYGRWFLTTTLYPASTQVIGHCPYGEVGDCLWVREALWACHAGLTLSMTEETRAEYFSVNGHYGIQYCADDFIPSPDYWMKRSPLFMPRWASRITLEITEVRVERLQEITDTDAVAEGCEHPDPEGKHIQIAPGFMREVFAAHWDYLNAKRGYPFASNPFVWCITFKRIKP